MFSISTFINCQNQLYVISAEVIVRDCFIFFVDELQKNVYL